MINKFNACEKDNKTRDYCVYRYLKQGTQKVMYVGKTNSSLRARITAHKYEKQFQENGPYDVEYIELSNKVETDCIEKFLINKWKPLLNEKDKVNSLTEGLSLESLSWIPYSNYNGVGLSDRRKKKMISDANEKTEFLKLAVCAAMNDESQGLFVSQKLYSTGLPLLSGFENIVTPYVQKTEMGYIYNLLPQVKEELLSDALQIATSIWLPILKICEMNDKEELQYSLLMEEIDFSDRIDEFVRNGFEDERSLYRYDMEFNRVSDEALRTYQKVFAGPPQISRRCSVEVDRFGYEAYIQFCKEDTASKIFSFIRELGLTNVVIPDYDQRMLKQKESPYKEKIEKRNLLERDSYDYFSTI